jgi:hypothetical protein
VFAVLLSGGQCLTIDADTIDVLGDEAYLFREDKTVAMIPLATCLAIYEAEDGRDNVKAPAE